MRASLPMYDRPQTAAANDRLWALIRDALQARGLAAPDDLTRGEDPWTTWQSPDLVFSQTCGMPYRTALHGKVALVAAPVWDIEGLPPGHYCSVIVSREGTRPDPRSAKVAVNDACSQSGWAAMVEWAGVPPDQIIISGGHVNSAQAVAEGLADLAAIDVVTWQMIMRWDPFASGLCVIDRTRPTPALPYITRLGADADATRAALRDAIASLSQEDRATLCINTVQALGSEHYLAVPTPAAPEITPE